MKQFCSKCRRYKTKNEFFSYQVTEIDTIDRWCAKCERKDNSLGPASNGDRPHWKKCMSCDKDFHTWSRYVMRCSPCKDDAKYYNTDGGFIYM